MYIYIYICIYIYVYTMIFGIFDILRMNINDFRAPIEALLRGPPSPLADAQVEQQQTSGGAAKIQVFLSQGWLQGGDLW